MVKRLIILAALCVCFCALQAQNESSARPAVAGLPPAPAGYAWQWVSGQPIAFLVPHGWYSYSAGPGVTFMEKGNSGKDNGFKTGFNFTLLKYEKDKFATPEKQLEELTRFVHSSPDVEVLSSDIRPATDYLSSQCYRVFFKKETPYGSVRGEQWFWYYSPGNSIFSCEFESPADDWDKASLTGQDILGNIFINVK